MRCNWNTGCELPTAGTYCIQFPWLWWVVLEHTSLVLHSFLVLDEHEAQGMSDCAGTQHGSRCGAEGTMQAARCLSRLWDVLVSTSTCSYLSLWTNPTSMVLGSLHLPPLHVDQGLLRYSLATSCPPLSLCFCSDHGLVHFMEPRTPSGSLSAVLVCKCLKPRQAAKSLPRCPLHTPALKVGCGNQGAAGGGIRSRLQSSDSSCELFWSLSAEQGLRELWGRGIFLFVSNLFILFLLNGVRVGLLFVLF